MVGLTISPNPRFMPLTALSSGRTVGIIFSDPGADVAYHSFSIQNSEASNEIHPVISTLSHSIYSLIVHNSGGSCCKIRVRYWCSAAFYPLLFAFQEMRLPVLCSGPGFGASLWSRPSMIVPWNIPKVMSTVESQTIVSCER